MAVNEMELVIDESDDSVTNRLLGIIGIIGAPMLFVEMLTRALMSQPEKLNTQVVGILGIFYIGGWIATAIGMRRMRTTGNSPASKIVFVIQIVGLVLAFLYSVQETLRITDKVNSLFFTVTDFAYPFSHAFMFIVGVLVWRTQILKGFAKFAPFFVALMLPLFFALSAFGSSALVPVIASGLAATGFVIISLAVFKRN